MPDLRRRAPRGRRRRRSGSRTAATAVPTLPGLASHSALEISVPIPGVGGGVCLVDHGPPPFDHRPFDLRRARCRGVPHGTQRVAVERGFDVLGKPQQAGEVGRNEVGVGDLVARRCRAARRRRRTVRRSTIEQPAANGTAPKMYGPPWYSGRRDQTAPRRLDPEQRQVSVHRQFAEFDLAAERHAGRAHALRAARWCRTCTSSPLPRALLAGSFGEASASICS